MRTRKKLNKDFGNTSVSPDSNVTDILDTYPRALEALIDLGLEPLKSAVTRKTVAKLFTLEQAAKFRGIKVDELIHAIKTSAGIEVSDPVSDVECKSHETMAGAVPQLQGDISFLGLVPCPIRNILMDKFDSFTQQLTASTGRTLAWWMAGEGTGTKDVRKWLVDIMKNREYKKIPDMLLAVGTEIFFQARYGKSLYDERAWLTIQVKHRRSDFEALEDPNGMLALQFAVLFAFSCRPENIPTGTIPKRWTDLLEPEYKGQIAFPTLDLPIVSDLLAALYHYLGDKNFRTLAGNTITDLHPSASSPRSGLKKVPGVVVLPLHFAKLSVSTGAEIVIPEDGPVAVPAYIATKSDAPGDSKSVRDFLMAKGFLELFWKYGSFVPNHEDITCDVDFSKLITQPWDSVFQNDPDAFVDRITEMMQSRGES